MTTSDDNLDTLFIICPTCAARFKRKKAQEEAHPLYFCAYCGSKLKTETRKDRVEKKELYDSVSIVSGQLPNSADVQSAVGQYQILERIAKGGMGEVFLSYDSVCGRKVALKRIRPDLVDTPHIQKRFLHEARITAQLSHPVIIPIYGIDCEDGAIYYTMPYVEGNTLKQILRQARNDEEKKHFRTHGKTTIPYLIRHFLQVCQAIAFSHANDVIHRDIKPENIMVGRYGQTYILDWGLAKKIGEQELPIATTLKETQYQTRLGKVVGTVSYMAPERALGKPATIMTDIYALGVILYQILTLHFPFRRKSMNSFKKHWKKEVWTPPEQMAPYREVPEVLAQAAKKCLNVHPEDRYQSVDELIQVLESYLEGRSEWFEGAVLNPARKEDWLFQENILLAEHTAITQAPESLDWVSLMISKENFAENIKVEATVTLGSESSGIGFLLSVSDVSDMQKIFHGYSLWLSTNYDKEHTTKLMLSSVSVLEAPEVILEPGKSYIIRVEKRKDTVSLYIDNKFVFSYTSHVPIFGNRMGLLMRDADLEVENLHVFVGSQDITVSILAVPDAFLARGMYTEALEEYRKIGKAFLGHQEGREALFRAGMTLLEEAKQATKKRDELFDKALDEFTKLSKTPGAPLEYLGKAYVYKENQEFEEETKCFELALRRYERHPLLPILHEEIVFRMHESSRQNRVTAYLFICLVARFIPEWAEKASSRSLFKNLLKHWEKPFFVLHQNDKDDPELERLSLCLGLSFWLAKPYVLAETFEEILSRPIVAIDYLTDALFLLVLLGAKDLAKDKEKRLYEVLSDGEKKRFAEKLTHIQTFLNLDSGVEWLQTLEKKKTSKDDERLIWLLLREAIDARNAEKIEAILLQLEKKRFSYVMPEVIDALVAEVFLYQNDLLKLEQIFKRYPKLRLLNEASFLFFPYACYITRTEGPQKALKIFSKLFDKAFPRSWQIASHFLAGKIHMTSAGWFSQSFMFERRTLYQQLALFWHAGQNREKSQSWHTLIFQETFET